MFCYPAVGLVRDDGIPWMLLRAPRGTVRRVVGNGRVSEPFFVAIARPCEASSLAAIAELEE